MSRMSAPCILQVLDHSGTEVTWDTDQPEEVAVARKLYASLADKKYLAYRVDGADAEVIRGFDPAAPKIVMSPQTVGG